MNARLLSLHDEEKLTIPTSCLFLNVVSGRAPPLFSALQLFPSLQALGSLNAVGHTPSGPANLKTFKSSVSFFSA